MRRRWLMLAVLPLLTGFTWIERAFLPEVELHDPRWTEMAETQEITLDHSAWDAFLSNYVTTDSEGINRVAYAAVTAEDRAALENYLASLQGTAVAKLTRDQQLAFWINLYNAQTVALILDHYPVESIRDINDGLFSPGPWDMPLMRIDGMELSLNDVEHRIIRPIFEEPRIHYALNCAATACPNLADKAWRAEGLDARFDEAELAYINDPRGVRITSDGKLILSKIYGWFQEDFGDSEKAVIDRLAGIAPPEMAAELKGRTRVDEYDYDWALNEQVSGS